MAGTGGSGIAATTSIAVATTTRGDAQQTATHVSCTKTTNTSNSSSCSRPTSKTRGATCAATTAPNESGCHTAAKDAASPADAMPSSSSVPSPPIATHSTDNTSADSKTNTACPASTACLFYACAVAEADASCTAGPHVLSLSVTWMPLSTFSFILQCHFHSFFYFFPFSAFQQGSLWVSSVILNLFAPAPSAYVIWGDLALHPPDPCIHLRAESVKLRQVWSQLPKNYKQLIAIWCYRTKSGIVGWEAGLQEYVVLAAAWYH